MLKQVVSKSEHPRILSLDGLRGIAIILVIINHMRLDLIPALFPSVLRWTWPIISSNGKTGVGVLFVLSGFLLAQFYPQIKSTFSFWQKRYFRIFPPLVAMCLSLGLIRLLWRTITTPQIIGIVLITSAILGLLWRAVQKSSRRVFLERAIFTVFFVFQIIAALFYLFVLVRVPSSVFYLVWPEWAQSIVTTIVNATLTLPFGIYIGQLDGAYWTLNTELTFYLLYPVMILPLFQVGRLQKWWTKVALAVLLLPFFYGLHLVSLNVLNFGIYNIQFFWYFLGGMAVALSPKVMSALSQKWQNISGPLKAVLEIIIVVTFFASNLIFGFIPHETHVLVQMLGLLPTLAVLILALIPSAWSKFLSNKFLVYLGGISYSLYITHTIAIEMFVRTGPPKTVEETFIKAVTSIVTMSVLAIWLNHWLEKPYFNRVKKDAQTGVAEKTSANSKGSEKKNPAPAKLAAESKQSELSVAQKITSVTSRLGLRPAILSLCILTGFLSFIIWAANRPPLSLTQGVEPVVMQELPNKIYLTTEPTTLKFVANQDNLGMILLHFKHETNLNGLKTPEDTQYAQVHITFQEVNGPVINELEQNLFQIAENRFHSIGFPIQANSQGKEYQLTFTVRDLWPGQGLSITTQPVLFHQVFFPNKSSLLKSPARLVRHVSSLIFYPFVFDTTKQELELMVPFMAVLWIALLWVRAQSQKETPASSARVFSKKK